MLEQMRQQSRSLLIYLLFGIVIAVFIVNFGPQSAGGCGMRSRSREGDNAAQVAGRPITIKDYQYAYMMVNGSAFPPQRAKAMRLKETIMDMLIDRELLALEAERLGMRVSDEEIEDMIAESKVVALGNEQRMPFSEDDGKFSYEQFRKFVQYHLGMSPKSFIEQQRRELMALRMRDLLRTGVGVSADEVKNDFVRQNDQVNLEYVRVPIHRYENDVELKPEEIAAYAKANQEKLKKLYDQRKAALYDKQPKQRKLRYLLVGVPSDASADATAEAGKKADALAVRLRKGENFAKLAKGTSSDERSKGRGGDLGWQRKSGTSLGTELEEKVWAAKDGELVGPTKIGAGFALVLPEATREGDITYEQASQELAESELRQERSRTRAESEAKAALAKAKAEPSKSLKDLFPAPPEGAKAVSPAPQAEETGLFAHRGTMVASIGPAPSVANAAFALTNEQPFGGPFEELGSFIVVKMKERKKPDMAEFEKDKARMVEEATRRKGAGLVMDWSLQRCQAVKDAKKIDVNAELLRYDNAGDTLPYEPCSPMRF